MEPLFESQVSTKSVSALNGPTTSVPDAERDPLQPPLATQPDTLVPDHVSVAEPPFATVKSDVLSVNSPAGGDGDGDGESEVPPELPHAASAARDNARNAERERV